MCWNTTSHARDGRSSWYRPLLPAPFSLRTETPLPALPMPPCFSPSGRFASVPSYGCVTSGLSRFLLLSIGSSRSTPSTTFLLRYMTSLSTCLSTVSVPSLRILNSNRSFDLSHRHPWLLLLSCLIFPDDTRLRNRYGFSVPLHSPSVTVVGKPIYVQRSDGTRRAMTPDEAKVLQGFPYGHDWSHTSTRLALQWYGDAVPPPFASAMGWALVRSHLCLPASWDCCFTPVPRTSLPCSPSCYYALPSGFSSPSLDDVLLSVAQHALPFSMVCCKRGVADSTDMSQIRLYSGSAFVSFRSCLATHRLGLRSPCPPRRTRPLLAPLRPSLRLTALL